MLFKSKRSESEILYDMLTVMKPGIKKTSLMYKAQLSYFQLNRYLGGLLDQSIIEEKTNKTQNKEYHLTEKGEKLLYSIENVLTFFE